jgi:hypothetical protein
VQEQLSFCIGNTAVNDATTTVSTCAAISGTSLNLGTLNSTEVNVSPVAAGNGGDGNNGLAELNTNAANGTTVYYDAVQAGTGTNELGTLRVAGATCSATTSLTDQCINAIGTTHTTLTAGTEAFGMTVAGVNCSLVTAYTCTFSAGTYNLVPNATYKCQLSGNTFPSGANDVNQVASTTCYYAWDQSGTQDVLASSTAPVGNEALILKFAATPNLVTPTGSYTAKADFVASPTF